MKEVNKEILKQASRNLMFEMSDEEYDTLLEEFGDIIEQLKIISDIDGIDDVEPMVFPYPVFVTEMREDIAKETPDRNEILKNSGDVVDGMIRLPKVVG